MKSSKIFSSSHRFQLITSFAVILSLSILLIGANFILRVQQITCVIEPNQICPNEVVTELTILKGENLLFNNIEQLIGSSNSIAQRYQVLKVEKTIFGNVTIHLMLQDTLYALRMNDGQYVVTAQGSMISSSEEATSKTLSNCTITMPEQFTMAKQLEVDQELHGKITSLIQGLRSRMIQCITVLPHDQNTWLITLHTDHTVVINPTDIDENLNRLMIVLSTPIESDGAKSDGYLDVRFSMPVLRKTL